MDATLSGETTAQASKQTTKEYKSPPHALIWFFRKSRDLWKSKYQELQASIKRLKNRVADVTKSREQWKLKAEQTNNQLTVLEAENASLRAQIATLAEKKTTRPSQGQRSTRLSNTYLAASSIPLTWCNGSCRWSPFAVRPCVAPPA